MFCIKICFLEPEPSEPSFYRWSRSQTFLPGPKPEPKKISGAGAAEKWLGSATLLEAVVIQTSTLCILLVHTVKRKIQILSVLYIGRFN